MIRYETLQDSLDDVNVFEVDAYHNEVNGGALSGILGWFGVDVGESGATAYFATEAQALHYRLAIINARLNPLNTNLGDQ